MNERTSTSTPSDPSEELEPSSGWLRALISAFIVFHLVAITAWNMPASHLQMRIKNHIRRYMVFVVLDQGWGMFSTPGRENYYMQARITYEDGRQAFQPIGKQHDLNPLARLINERERKMTENLYVPSNGQPYYNQIALWALRKVPKPPHNPPVRVELTRHWSPIPPLPDGLRMPPVSSWNSDVVYSLGLSKGAKL